MAEETVANVDSVEVNVKVKCEHHVGTNKKGEPYDFKAFKLILKDGSEVSVKTNYETTNLLYNALISQK